MRLISIALITLFLTASTVSADSTRESRGGGGDFLTSPAKLTALAEYDLNGDGIINRNEVIQAITRYFAGEIARDVVLSLIAAYFSGDQVGTTPPPQLSDMIERVRPAVVKVIASGGLGSGAIYKTDSQYAYVVTNQHVIGSASTVTVKVEDATDYSGTVLGVDVARDLAVVRIDCPGCAHIEFGDSQTLNLGDEVVALGYPRDSVLPVAERETAARRIVPRSMSVTKGIVSAFRYDSEKDVQLVQTDTAINPGNSGGPLVSLDGKIMGINTFIITDSDNIGFAVLETTVRGTPPHPRGRNLPGPNAEPGLGVATGAGLRTCSGAYAPRLRRLH